MPRGVHVVVEVDKSAPISAATRASLGLQGVTGLLYVNLKEASDVDRSAPLRRASSYPVIEAVESDFDAFLASLPEVMGRANTLLERVSRVVSDENLAGIATTPSRACETDGDRAADGEGRRSS